MKTTIARTALYLGSLIFTVLFGCLSTTRSQPILDPPAPGAELSCPKYGLAGHQELVLWVDIYGKEFIAKVSGKDAAYRWQIVGGRILNGQGTARITIEPINQGLKSIVQLEIKVVLDGLPPYADAEKSCQISVDLSCPRPHLFESIRPTALDEGRLDFDRLGKYLTTASPESAVFLVAYGGRKPCLWEAAAAANRAKKYLVNALGIDPARVVAVDGGFREHPSMDIFVAARTSCGPFPSPTLRPSDVDHDISCGSIPSGKP